jgi:hypothetical protein
LGTIRWRWVNATATTSKLLPIIGEIYNSTAGKI